MGRLTTTEISSGRTAEEGSLRASVIGSSDFVFCDVSRRQATREATGGPRGLERAVVGVEILSCSRAAIVSLDQELIHGQRMQYCD